jgi:hypothetical protein
MKQTTTKQRGNSAKRVCGKPFDKGNPHAFKPGKSGNPAGRPKRTKLSEALLAKMAELAPGQAEETIAERVAQALIDEALKGNVQAIREIGDRCEGKPKQVLDVDMNLRDWRALARAHGLNEYDVLDEARRLIESAAVSGGAQPDGEAATR